MLRKGYQSAAEGLLPAADTQITSAIGEWKKSAQPPEEISALYKLRSSVRQQQGRLPEALSDLDEAVTLIASGEPAEIQRTVLLRARVNAALGRWQQAESDFSSAIQRLDQLSAIESTNPFVYAERGAVRSRLGRFDGAADDALTAAVEFKSIGDKLRSLLAASDAALALYGAGEVDDAVDKMRTTFNSYGNKSPATNNPDDIGLLQELARREAELHLAYASHLYGVVGNAAEAQQQWEKGCVRLESFVQDAMQREDRELALRAAEARQAEASGKEAAGTLRASSVADNPMNTPLIARLNGMDPDSPAITQRPGTGYTWYKVGGEAAVERRNAGTQLVSVDAGLSCARFRKTAWINENRPEWPPNLVENANKYASGVAQGAVVIPPKGSQFDKSQCSVLLSRPGVGDAVPCF